MVARLIHFSREWNVSYIAIMLCSHYTDDVDHDEKEKGGTTLMTLLT